MEGDEVISSLNLPRKHTLVEMDCGGSHLWALAKDMALAAPNDIKVLSLDVEGQGTRLRVNRFFTASSAVSTPRRGKTREVNNRKANNNMALGIAAGLSHSMVPLAGGGIAIIGDYLDETYSAPQVFWPEGKFTQVRTANGFAIAQGEVESGKFSLFKVENPTEEPTEIDLSILFDGSSYKVRDVVAGPSDCFIRVDKD